jgi:hypothetical protein
VSRAMVRAWPIRARLSSLRVIGPRREGHAAQRGCKSAVPVCPARGFSHSATSSGAPSRQLPKVGEASSAFSAAASALRSRNWMILRPMSHFVALRGRGAANALPR